MAKFNRVRLNCLDGILHKHIEKEGARISAVIMIFLPETNEPLVYHLGDPKDIKVELDDSPLGSLSRHLRNITEDQRKKLLKEILTGDLPTHSIEAKHPTLED